MPHHGAGVQSLALGACWGKPVWQAHGGQGTWKEADSGVPPGGLHPLGHPGEMPQNTAPRKSGAGRTAAQTPTSATPQACPAPPLPPPAPSSRTGPSLGPPFGSICLGFCVSVRLLELPSFEASEGRPRPCAWGSTGRQHRGGGSQFARGSTGRQHWGGGSQSTLAWLAWCPSSGPTLPSCALQGPIPTLGLGGETPPSLRGHP